MIFLFDSGDELPLFVTLTNDLSPATVTSLSDLPLSLMAVTGLRNTGPSTSNSTDIVINYPIETRSSALLYYLVAVEVSLYVTHRCTGLNFL